MYFREKTDKLNWRNIQTMNFNTTNLEQNPNFEEIVRNIVHSILDTEDLRLFQSERMIKIFLMDQVLIEYLLNIQEKLYKKNATIVELHYDFKGKNDENRSELENNKERIQELMNKKKMLKKKNNDYRILRKKACCYSCPYCEKVFSTLDFLEKHLIKRHAYELRLAREEELKHQKEEKLKRMVEEAKVLGTMEKKELADKLRKEAEEKVRREKERNQKELVKLNQTLESKMKENEVLLEDYKNLERKSNLKDRKVKKLMEEKEKLAKENEQVKNAPAKIIEKIVEKKVTVDPPKKVVKMEVQSLKVSNSLLIFEGIMIKGVKKKEPPKVIEVKQVYKKVETKVNAKPTEKPSKDTSMIHSEASDLNTTRDGLADEPYLVKSELVS